MKWNNNKTKWYESQMVRYAHTHTQISNLLFFGHDIWIFVCFARNCIQRNRLNWYVWPIKLHMNKMNKQHFLLPIPFIMNVCNFKNLKKEFQINSNKTSFVLLLLLLWFFVVLFYFNTIGISVYYSGTAISDQQLSVNFCLTRANSDVDILLSICYDMCLLFFSWCIGQIRN